MENVVKKPQMGWNSYCSVNCEPSEEYILRTAVEMRDKGLLSAGYRYICIDDGWMETTRSGDGKIRERKDRFPHGMKYLTDRLHEMGFLAGIYLGDGETTWNRDTGSLGHEYDDADTIAEMGFDYLKYDYYVLPKENRDVPGEYRKMADALKKSGREILFAMCEHGRSKAHTWAEGIGHSFRTGLDIRDNYSSLDKDGNGDKDGFMDVIDYDIAPITDYVKNGFYADPDFLVVGMNGGTWMKGGCTKEEYYTHFALWCLVSAPLMIGADVSALDADSLSILKDEFLISIDQDEKGKAAKRVAHDRNGFDIWKKELSDSSTVLAVVNRKNTDDTFGIDMTEYSDYDHADVYGFGNKTRIENRSTIFSLTLKSHECRLVRFY